jgi:hypothetical protein
MYELLYELLYEPLYIYVHTYLPTRPIFAAYFLTPMWVCSFKNVTMISLSAFTRSFYPLLNILCSALYTFVLTCATHIRKKFCSCRNVKNDSLVTFRWAKMVKLFLIHRRRQAQDSLEKIFDMGSLERPSKMADLSFNKRALLMRTDGGLSGWQCFQLWRWRRDSLSGLWIHTNWALLSVWPDGAVFIYFLWPMPLFLI